MKRRWCSTGPWWAWQFQAQFEYDVLRLISVDVQEKAGNLLRKARFRWRNECILFRQLWDKALIKLVSCDFFSNRESNLLTPHASHVERGFSILGILKKTASIHGPCCVERWSSRDFLSDCKCFFDTCDISITPDFHGNSTPSESAWGSTSKKLGFVCEADQEDSCE